MKRRALTLFMIRQAGLEEGPAASPFWAIYWVRWNGRARRRVNRAWRRWSKRAVAIASTIAEACAVPSLIRGKPVIARARDVASDDGLADRAADAVARFIAETSIEPEHLTGDLSNVTHASYRAGRAQFNAYIGRRGALSQRLQRTLRDDLTDFEDFERQRVMLNLLCAEAKRKCQGS